MKNKSTTITLVLVFLLSILFSSVVKAKDKDFINTGTIKFGEKIYIGEDEVENSDVISLGGDIYVSGKVNGNVVALAGNIYINGEVSGNVTSIAGTITLNYNSVVKGSTSEIIKDVHLPKWDIKGFFRNKRAAYNYNIILSFIILTLFSILIYKVMPIKVYYITRAIPRNTFKNILYGYIVLLLGILISVALILSLAGIIIIPVLVIMIYILFIVGFASMALYLGEKVRSLLNLNKISKSLSIIIGVGTIELIRSITVFNLGSIFWRIFIIPLCIGIVFTSRFGSYMPLDYWDDKWD
ncbi:cytoskeletal protein CcmA (bactofilin family) [Clostridium tetanomorphum]|uniref:polymer-forming cytoskeletal protein n=1 Tax=Clostridium tetanomorphum TaxID=1553 RepID=UPI00044DFC6B|nr:polymer-forming cytoskeletal protein [Clostridium tetanomorphum]KAJ53335.1 hypothetical protein CTM_03554 [Clostridium tetanomorphum DSM 665]MBP1866286.1 cytoskeletal protein CcmA (bactofilin family) [Clostridium tetanomorphum]NRS86056.1 cytoskeletal protein CcmA (bactofilin family) [Clostridium tetanomorphum]SQB89718.1 Uncharacterised protein [Clostridium tetanomorphum]